MSVDGSIEIAWCGDERRFRLGIGELLALQERRDSGPAEIFNRLRYGTWRVEDIQEVLRIGLIGGGREAKAARELVDVNVTDGRLLEHLDYAIAVLGRALQADEPIGKRDADAETPMKLSAATLYGNGAVMGYTPQELDRMSLFQFAACIEGYNRGQRVELEPPSAEEFEAAKRLHGDADDDASAGSDADG